MAERHCCRVCGAQLGYIGRAVQWAIGCQQVRGCHGNDFQRHLMSLPTTSWYVAFFGLTAVVILALGASGF